MPASRPCGINDKKSMWWFIKKVDRCDDPAGQIEHLVSISSFLSYLNVFFKDDNWFVFLLVDSTAICIVTFANSLTLEQKLVLMALIVHYKYSDF